MHKDGTRTSRKFSGTSRPFSSHALSASWALRSSMSCAAIQRFTGNSSSVRSSGFPSQKVSNRRTKGKESGTTHRESLQAGEADVGLLGHGALKERIYLCWGRRVLHRFRHVGESSRSRSTESRVGEERREEVADHGEARERRVRAYSRSSPSVRDFAMICKSV